MPRGFSQNTEDRTAIEKRKFIIYKAINLVLGKKHTDESRARITAAQTGKKRGPHSEKHKENIRKALLGRTLTEEQKIKISKTLTGMVVSDEARVNISKAHKGLKAEDSARENMRKAWEIRKEKSLSGHGYLKNGLPDYRGKVQT